MKGTVILGAGFGGLATATELRRRLGTGHEIVLVDHREHFLIGLRKLWALVGLGTLEEGRRSRRALNERALSWVRENVRQIDPVARRVITDTGSHEGDTLVVALGAEPRADLVPGLAAHGHNLYDVEAIPPLAEALAGLSRGRIAVVIAGGPYKCPPAPYECAMLLDDHLRSDGRRHAIDLVVTTFQPLLLPNAGEEGSRWLGEQLAARGITYATGRKVREVREGEVAFVDADALPADVIIVVPPHRPPAVVQEAGLTGTGDWVRVDPGTLSTGHEGVFAVGDVTHIPLANGLPLPKAGLFAERHGEHVAATIAARVRGEDPPPPFDGIGYCFIETGKTTATRVEGDFFARPEPAISIVGVSAEHAEEKRRFEAERLARWFGR